MLRRMKRTVEMDRAVHIAGDQWRGGIFMGGGWWG